MKQINRFVYELDEGTRVSIHLVPTGVAHHHLVATLDGRPFRQVPSDPLAFEFALFEHESVLAIAAAFDNPQPNSKYDVFIRAPNEEEKRGPTIDPENPTIAIRFRTRTGPPK